MIFDVLTIFPKILDSYLAESLVKRALSRGVLSVRVHDLRKFATDRHKKVDDRPFGGGPGMVLKIEPIYKAICSILKISNSQFPISKQKRKKTRIVLFSTRGKKLDAAGARRLAKYQRLILICGRYEGVDERVAEHIADEEISIGDFVLSGGEIPALVTIEAVARFLPGFFGKHGSLEELKGSYPTYSRPEVFEPKKGVRWRVPKVLLSGSHKNIDAWRRRI